MACDLCGKDVQLFRAIIEGTEMDVCAACAAFGKVISKARVTQAPKRTATAPEKEIIEHIAEDYSDSVRRERERMGLSQKDFALKLSERESIIHKIETGRIRPSIPLARKIEKFLKIKLVEEEEVVHTKEKAPKTEEFTLGDFIKVKK